MPLKLNHIGEPLVEAIANADPDLFYRHCGLSRAPGLEAEVAIELELQPWGNRSFDPVSRVDLGIVVSEDKVIPVEIKMGLAGLSTKQVSDRLVPWQHSNHRDPRWRGSMMAVLDRRYPVELAESVEPLRATFAGRSVELTEDWIIIARRAVVQAWQKERPAFKSKVRFVVFEDLAKDFGEERFNRTVQDLLPINLYRHLLGDGSNCGSSAACDGRTQDHRESSGVPRSTGSTATSPPTSGAPPSPTTNSNPAGECNDPGTTDEEIEGDRMGT